MWYIDENLGLYNDQFFPVPPYAVICPVAPCVWHIDPLANSGFPICDLMIGIPRLRINSVKQDPYVSVYDITTANKEDFNGNGSAILCPTECRVKQIENGEWSVSLVHPMDEDGKWTYLRERNYLKVLGQVFTIIYCETDYDKRTVTCFAEHIFYQLNDAWIFSNPYEEDTRFITGDNGQEILNDIMVSATWYSPSPYIVFPFQYYSDIPSASFAISVTNGGMTPVQAICGSGGMTEITSGKLFRDNFYFSVNQQMEDSDDNAFDIRVGCNLHGIVRKIDTSQMATLARVGDGKGNWWSISWGSAWQTLQALPHNIVRAAVQDALNMDDLFAKACAFFGKNCAPIVSYKFDIADSIGNPVYDDISKMYRFEVGDSGQLYDDRIGGSMHLTITETEKDGITGRTLSFTVGNTSSFVRSGSAPVDVPEPTVLHKRFIWRDKNGAVLADKNGAILYTED